MSQNVPSCPNVPRIEFKSSEIAVAFYVHNRCDFFFAYLECLFRSFGARLRLGLIVGRDREKTVETAYAKRKHTSMDSDKH